MSSTELPKKIKPKEMTRTGLRLKGTISVAEMPRLQPLLAECDTPVQVELVGGTDEQGIGFIKGRITADLMIPCQRCLKAMPYEMVVLVMLSPVTSDQEAQRLPERYEPLLLEEDTLALSEVVEDELILSMPLVAMHEDTECWQQTA